MSGGDTGNDASVIERWTKRIGKGMGNSEHPQTMRVLQMERKLMAKVIAPGKVHITDGSGCRNSSILEALHIRYNIIPLEINIIR